MSIAHSDVYRLLLTADCDITCQLPKAHTDISTGMHQQSALLIGFGCCCCHSKHSFPLKGSSHVDRFPFHDHKHAKVTDMKTEEDVSDQCVQFVCISAKKKKSINYY